MPVAVLLGVAVLAAACSGDDDDRGVTNAPSAVTDDTTTAPSRSDGPMADLSEEITGGAGPFIGAASAVSLEGTGYVEHEYVAAGTAESYAAQSPLTGDGRWVFEPAGAAPYRTRVLVRRPADAEDFSGTVVLEWLNVSGGLDASPDYSYLHEELVRQGHAWVGVSAQLIGVMGGPVLVTVSVPGAENVTGKGLVAIDPARYASLEHPGDGYSFDIFTQVARAVRAGGTALGDLEPERVIAAGESQSAFALVTYVNGVQPLTHAFDGFFVHSRGAVGLPVAAPGEPSDIAGSLGGTTTIFRTDTDVPILDLQTESDVTGVLNSVAARQPDSDRFRLWEVAGSAHADAYLLGATADAISCGAQINNAPLHVVAKAALRSLDEWVRTGSQPPEAPRLEVTSGATVEMQRDEDGIALGGVRTPPVDVPVDVLSGVPGPDPSIICLLLGSTVPLAPERIAALYPSRDAYEAAYEEAVDAVIDAGFALEEDRNALQSFADPSRITR